VDRGVVDEHVERSRLPAQRPDRLLIRHVEAHGANAVDLRNASRISRAGQDLEPGRGKLPGDLEPEPAVGAGHERGGHSPIITRRAAGPRRVGE